jgi:CBS domain-containing protein
MPPADRAPVYVAQVMSTNVFSVPANMPVAEVSRILTERRFTGAPVVDAEGKLIGVISQTDLLSDKVQRAASEGDAAAPVQTAESVMTPLVCTVPRDTDIRAAARLMVNEKIHRLIVTDGERVVGIVSTLDLLRAFAE